MNAQPCYTDLDTVIHGDALAVLRGMETSSMDACVVDPPYGLGEVKDIAGLLNAWILDQDDIAYIGKSGFMGKEWDAGVPGPRYWREVLRVLKPGAHILCFAGTRTVDLMMVSLRLAGFQIRDELMWIHGQGFPKSTAIDKQIDKMKGAEREVIGHGTSGKILRANGQNERPYQQGKDRIEHDITAPATPEAQQWQGYGTALKPAHEPIILARKPLAEHSIAANVLKYGTGGINVDACRVGTNDVLTGSGSAPLRYGGQNHRPFHDNNEARGCNQHPQGRFPSHLLLSHSIWCVPTGTKRVRVNDKAHDRHNGFDTYGFTTPHMSTGYADSDGYEQVDAYDCHESCPIRALDEQSGVRKSVRSARGGFNGNKVYGNFAEPTNYECGYDDQGGASRYFTNFPPDDFTPFLYMSKASRAERNRGCEDLPYHSPGECTDRKDGSAGLNNPRAGAGRTSGNQNVHPTVKPLSLMRWLIRLITPPGGVVLDCFAGSGSTLVAAIHEGVHFIGIEQSEEYCTIARSRIAHAYQEVRW